ncbi:rhodanese-like domain-containing protein [Treponema sp. HNW]|uniref:rhodanese-like domain-containing protein n=1 Tax=Treponema sp. HNW TaxID=3116654 RepID=UPI003D143986
MKPILIFLAVCILSSCTKQKSPADSHTGKKTGIQAYSITQAHPAEQHNYSLPEKPKTESMLMSESPIKPYNIDEYLFMDNCIYIDLRSPDAFYKEGHIAGFTNIPFYGYIADFPNSDKGLFTLTRKGGLYLGDTGSFEQNYKESVQILYDIFPKNKTIIAISTAGVESCYFLNLLVQLGYNPEKLYNAGSFTNGMGNDPAYRTLPNVRYLVGGIELYDSRISYSFRNLTKIGK